MIDLITCRMNYDEVNINFDQTVSVLNSFGSIIRRGGEREKARSRSTARRAAAVGCGRMGSTLMGPLQK